MNTLCTGLPSSRGVPGTYPQPPHSPPLSPHSTDEAESVQGDTTPSHQHQLPPCHQSLSSQYSALYSTTIQPNTTKLRQRHGHIFS